MAGRLQLAGEGIGLPGAEPAGELNGHLTGLAVPVEDQGGGIGSIEAQGEGVASGWLVGREEAEQQGIVGVGAELLHLEVD